MKETEAIRQCVIQILADNGESGMEILEEHFPESEYGQMANHLYGTLDGCPELSAIDHLCCVLSGELARHPNSSTLELKEAENIACMLANHSERLIEIGQENKGHDGLIIIGSLLTSLRDSIRSILVNA